MKNPKFQLGVLLFATALGIGFVGAEEGAPAVQRPASQRAAGPQKGNAETIQEEAPKKNDGVSDSADSYKAQEVIEEETREDTRETREIKEEAGRSKMEGKDAEIGAKKDKLEHDAGDAASQSGRGAGSVQAPHVSTGATPSAAAGPQKVNTDQKKSPEPAPATVTAPKKAPREKDGNSDTSDMYKEMNAFDKESQEDAREMRGEKGAARRSKMPGKDAEMQNKQDRLENETEDANPRLRGGAGQ